MANLESGEGMMIVGGQLEGPYICQDYRQGVVMKFRSNYAGGDLYGPHVIHTGMSGKIYNDVFPQGEERCDDMSDVPYFSTPFARIVTTGNDAEVYDNGQQTIIASLAKSNVEYNYWDAEIKDGAIDDQSKVMHGNVAFLAGNHSYLRAGSEYDFINSTIVSTGNDVGIDINPSQNNSNLQQNKVITTGQSSTINMANESIAVSLGDDSTVDTTHDSVVVITGKDSRAQVGNNSVIFNSGNSTEIAPGDDSLILSSENSTLFSLGVGSCAAIAWHDGTRKRVKVVYEGEDGIQAGMSYQVDQNGNVITA